MEFDFYFPLNCGEPGFGMALDWMSVTTAF